MLLNSVVIVLREVLEAALMISVLLGSTRFFGVGNRWVFTALAAGTAGAVTYAYFLEPVSDLFSGVGQEVCNATLQFSTFALLLAIMFHIPRGSCYTRLSRAAVLCLMTSAAALAITREGAEILVYVSGFWSMNDFFSAIAIGSFIGAGIGSSIGILIYYALLALPVGRSLPLIVVLLFFISAGMSSQAVRLLLQADWISASGTLWDTSGILSEQSLAGQLLYALVGYEATPTAIEVVVYLASMVLMAAAFFAGRFFVRSSRDDPE